MRMNVKSPHPAQDPESAARENPAVAVLPTGEASDEGSAASEPEPEPSELEDLDHIENLPAIIEDEPGTLALVPLEPATARSIAPYDPLTQYVNEIRRYPLLSREEEHELAVRYLKTGDRELAKQLVTANLRLVVKISHEYRRAYRNLLDLVQEGNIGLMQAVKRYDPYRGIKLSTYAAWWIRAYILKFILNNWRLVKLGTTQAQRKLFFNLRKEKEVLEREGFAPEAKLLAERLDVSEKEIDDMEQRLGSEQSLDAPLSYDEDSGRTHLDLLPSEANQPDVTAEADEFRALLREKLATFAKTLHGRELTIFEERLHAETPLTLQEIGDHYGVTRERARQLEKSLATKLRVYLRKELGDAVEIAMGLED